MNCEFCLKYATNPETGEADLGRDGKPMLREDFGGACPAPCRTDKGCPKGTPEKPNTLNSVNKQVWEHYRECRAVGQFPDDPIVRRHAAIIRDICDAHDKAQKRNELSQMLTTLSLIAEVQK